MIREWPEGNCGRMREVYSLPMWTKELARIIDAHSELNEKVRATGITPEKVAQLVTLGDLLALQIKKHYGTGEWK